MRTAKFILQDFRQEEILNILKITSKVLNTQEGFNSALKDTEVDDLIDIKRKLNYHFKIPSDFERLYTVVDDDGELDAWQKRQEEWIERHK